MANQKYTLTFDAQLNVQQMKGALSQIQNSLNNLQLPQNVTKGLSESFNKLTREVQNFEIESSKSITKKSDFSKLERSADKIITQFERLKLQVKDLANLPKADLEKIFPESITNNLKDARKALSDYSNAVAKANTDIAKAQQKIQNINNAITKENSKNILTGDQFKQLKNDIKQTENDLTSLNDKLKQLQNDQVALQNKLSQPTKSSTYRQILKDIQDTEKEIKNLKGQLDTLTTKQINSTTNVEHTKEITKLNEEYNKAIQNLQNFQNQLIQLQSIQTGGGLEQLIKEIEKITGLDMSKFTPDVKGIGDAIQTYLNNSLQSLQTNLNNTSNVLLNFDSTMHQTQQDVRDFGKQLEEYDARARDINSLKMRIQYFFGLNNAIQLVRRTIRSAYQTISELDKAMTETAVVTNFTVSDMWSQLPEYTKRANELGVATLDAYKAATLYYQQGLKTNEVTALSNETLKMARIAGLDAAEATDRMTNALRGFNMALTETNAQRVDDVYSQLAAITASNVDEISTAMTKVASLAHNANMEFENTAAFLAQIIETTRESAETAGTALKTVVARFSEVKKLVSKDELTGTDEEGELIDVNKVSTALRTAGIDLNKYFLGEVGLDDIFIELASKWDNLTSVQQRYIATQAAGSRQQSRFIALMSDYARTQELTTAAYNSNGAAAKQFEKTQESLQSKLAKLKNAWNEFTMSITNSNLVKAGVDILTTLLNIVNKLTSGFGALTNGIGGFINALAKISLSVGLLKVFSVLASGGMATLSNIVKPGGPTAKTAMVTNVLGSEQVKKMTGQQIQQYSTGKLLGQAFISPFSGILNARKEFLNNSSVKGYWEKIGYNYSNKQKILRYNSNTYTPKTLFGALGNQFTNGEGAIGKFGANLAKKLGFTGALVGPATLATALAGVTAAGVTAYAIIKKIYDASPEGQLKAAEKLQDSITQTYNDLQSTNSSLKSIISSYHDAQEQLKLTTYGTQEWAEALNNVNNTVLDIVDKFPTLAQYLTTNASGVMSLNEEGLKVYQEELSNRITDQAFMKMAAGGNVAQKRAATLTGEEAAQQERLAIAQYRAAFNSKYGKQFNQETINALSESFDYSKWAKEAAKDNDVGKFLGEDFWVSRKEWRRRYQEATGSEALDSWSSNDIASALARFDALPKIEEQLESLANFVKSGKEAENIEKIISGDKTATLDDSLKNYLQNRDKSTYNSISEQYGIYGESVEGILADTIQKREQLDKEFLLSYLTQQGININDFLKVNNFNSIGEAAEKLIEQAENIQAQNEAASNATKEIFSKAFTAGRASEIQSAFIGLTGEQAGKNVSAEQYYKIGEVFKQLGIAGVSGDDLGRFKGYAKQLEDNEEKLQQFYSILSSLDVTDETSIKNIFKAFEDLGIDFKDLGEDANEASNKFIELAHVIRDLDFDKLKKTVADTATFLKDLSERDQTDRVFTEEEFNQFIKGTDAEENFIYTGISGQEYVYYGDKLDTIIDLLAEQLDITVKTGKEQLNKQIDFGEAIENSPIAKHVLERLSNGEGRSAYANSIIGLESLLNNYGESIINLEGEDLKNKAAEILATYTGAGLENLKTQQTNYENYVAAPGYLRESVYELQSDKTLSDEDKNNYLEAKYQTDEVAAQVRDHIYETLKKQNVEESKALKIARDLALVYSEQAKKIDKINEAISKNKEGLQAGNKAAITNVAKSLAGMYGLKNQGKLESLVSQHKEELLQMEQDDEAYYKVLAALHQQWMEENASSYEALDDQTKQWLDGLTNELTSVPPLEVYANLDTTPFDKNVAGMFDTVEDFEAYIAGLGWAINWDAYQGKDIDLQTLLSGEMHLVRISNSGSKGYTGHGGGGGGGGNNDWKNELDRLYNLLEDIEENQRIQQKLQDDYNRLLKHPDTTAKDLIDNVMAQVTAKTVEAEQQGARYVERERDLYNYLKENDKYSQYVRYNYDDKTVEINWDLINSLKETDKETYDKIVEIANHAKELESDRDTANDRIEEIKDEILELQDIWNETYIQFEDRVRQALTQSYQKVIDNYSELSSTLSQTASDILQSLQDEITLQRQIRDNTKTEEEIGNKEARLAFLRRDTTGANQDEILRLEKELDESRQNYGDTLIDQEIQRLSDANSKAAEQREHQINIMQAQLDYQKDNKEFTDEITGLIKDGFDDAGNLIHGSELETLLQKEENWKALSEAQQKKWNEELAIQTSQVGAYLVGTEQGTVGAAVQSIFKSSIESIDKIQKVTDDLSGKIESSIKTEADDGGSLNNLFDEAQSGLLEAFFGTPDGKNPSNESFAGALENYWENDLLWPGFGKDQNGNSENTLKGSLDNIQRDLIDSIDSLLGKVDSSGNRSGGILGNLTGALGGLTSEINSAFGTYASAANYTGGDTNGGGGPDIPSTPKKWKIVPSNSSWQKKFNELGLGGEYSTWTAASTAKKNKIKDLEYNDPLGIESDLLEQLKKASIISYKTGGLASFTGPAWLDGTKSKPEYVLNAEQTTAFLKLADVLPQLLRAPTSTITNNQTSGDIYLDLVMNVDQIADDYDVDKIADRVKEIIYDASSYRNVNVLNFIK